MNFAEIDQKRSALGLPAYALCRRAGVAYSTYWRLKTGGGPARSLTLRRLSEALAGQTREPARIARPLIQQYFSTVHAICAQALGIDEAEAINVNPHGNKPRDKGWLSQMQARRLATYLVVTVGNVRSAELAREIGVSKQAVSKSLKAVEDLRDDPAFDSLLDKVADLMRGRAA
jgi:transcriptional regulator with XRE-family HTH domain